MKLKNIFHLGAAKKEVNINTLAKATKLDEINLDFMGQTGYKPARASDAFYSQPRIYRKLKNELYGGIRYKTVEFLYYGKDSLFL